MKIVVTGASGFLGQMIVPRLLERQYQVLVVGRSVSRLNQLFPRCEAFSYDRLAEDARGADALLHLAVANNNTGLSAADMRGVNVDFAMNVAAAAKHAGVPLFVNVSSVHALEGDSSHPYAVTKREAAGRLQALQGIEVRSAFLPLVYGESWSGSLAWLNRFPPAVAGHLFRPLAAIKPTVHVDRIIEWMESGAPTRITEPCILSDSQPSNSYYAWTRRFVDLAFALVVVLFFWWLLALLWAAVRLSSAGPGIFAQARVGQHSRVFTCYKFRTMAVGTKEVGTHEINAQSVTGIGSMLRKTKLDELPQVWNILRNEMSLIGPRPCLPSQTELIAERQLRGVLDVKPGISGLAQINGVDMGTPQRLAQWDAKYIALRGLVLDAKIAIATAIGRGRGDRTG